jgi:hypothetical protein
MDFTRKFGSSHTVVVVGVCGLLALATSLHAQGPGDDASRALATLEHLGAKVKRNEAAPGKPVVAIDLRETNITNEGLKDLAFFPQLQLVDLRRTRITDAGLKELAKVRRLRHLELGDTQVTGTGLRDLVPLTQLDTLRLERTPITDESLKDLAELPQIRSLSLEATDISDAGLKAVGTLKNLEALNLGQTKVTDAGVKELAGLVQLGWLGLYHTALTDAGLKEISKLPHLSNVMLNGTAVTDAGIKEFDALKSLRKVDLRDTQVTEAGLKGLKAAAPAVTVATEPLPAAAGSTRSHAWLIALAIIVPFFALSLVGAWLYARRGKGSAAGVPAALVVAPGNGMHSLKKRWGLPALALILLLLLGGWFLRPYPPATPVSLVNITVGCESVPEVEESGFHYQEYFRGQPNRWTDGSARLVIPIEKGKPPEALTVQLAAYRSGQVRNAKVKIVVNDRPLFDDEIPLGSWERTLDLHGIDLGDRVILDLISDAFAPLGNNKGDGTGKSDDPRVLGVQVRGVKLVRAADLPAVEPAKTIDTPMVVWRTHPDGFAFGGIARDGMTVMTGSWDGTLKIWNGPGTELQRSLPRFVPYLRALALSPDGRSFATVAADRLVRVWDTKTRELRGRFVGHIGQVASLAFAPDGKTLASAGDDNQNAGELRLWDLAGGTKGVRVTMFPFRLWGVAFAPDGKRVAIVGADRTVQVVDAESGRVRSTISLPFFGRRVAFSPDGAVLAVAFGNDGQVRLVEADSGKQRAEFQTPRGTRVTDLEFSRDGKRLLTPCADGDTLLWDVTEPKVRAWAALKKHEGPVRFALLSAGDQIVVTGGDDRIIRLWKIGDEVLAAPK